ncbi:DUF4340 domain-containing protein [Zavarzinella formosa]|uniref:DUF4340 domain-containing protein n=1 Tax=Zavarzinella formosa TaxID=360055 RepID=UPI00031FB97D|nr:DUF4340 domain-containing protein [Zavarzinella formosa]
MNFRTTFVLLLVGGAVGALVWKRDTVSEMAGLAEKPINPQPRETSGTLGELRADRISAITVRVAGSTPVELTAAGPGLPLELPGNWPVRRNEVGELIGVITNLKSRFQPIPMGTEENLRNFGLIASHNQSPIFADVVTRSPEGQIQLIHLSFGQPLPAPGGNPFLMPAFVRVNDEPSVYSVSQDVLAILRRPLDFYRKRQVFPEAERVKIADSARDTGSAQPTFLMTDAVTAINVSGPNGGYTLTRVAPTPKPAPPVDKPTGEAILPASALAESWRLVSPVSDRADPVKLKNVLTAIPDLWVEQFIINPDPLLSLTSFSPVLFGDMPLTSTIRYVGGVVEADSYSQNGPFLDITGLKNPPMTLAVTMADGSTRTLLVGKVSRTTKRTEPAPPPMIPGQPPSPPRVIEEPYYFAKLPNTPLVFEIKGERLKDVFLLPPPPEGPKVEFTGKAHEQLRDANVVRFETEHVTGVEIRGPNQTLHLKKTKKDPKAESESARTDRWDLTAPFRGLAETKQVTDLLDPLDRLAAKRGDIIDRAALHAITGSMGAIDLRLAGLTADQAITVELTSDEKAKVPARTLLVGKHDAAKKKFFVWSPATPNRINQVDDAAWAVIDRQPRAYRALKLFDLGDDRVESIRVAGAKGTFGLQETFDSKKTYRLTEPVATETDTEKSAKLLADLGSLEATEYVYDPPGEKDLAAIGAFLGALGENLLKTASGSFGFDKPMATVTLNFGGPKEMPARQLVIGKARDGKPEYYARLDGSPSVFTIKKEVPETLAAGSLGLLPTQLWNGSPDGLAVAEVNRGKETPYTLKQEGGTWKLTAPFEAAVDAPAVIPLATALSAVKAERYEAHVAKSLTEYGLDNPALRVRFTLTERLVAKPGDEPKETTKERVLLIGKPEGEGKPGRFAKLEGDANPAVFVLSDKTFADLDKPALELLNKKLLSLNPSAVTKLELTGPDGPITLEKQGNDWKPVGAVFPVDRPTVDQLIRYLSNLTALKFAEYGPNLPFAKYGLDPASKPVTLKVSLGMETHTLEIGKVAEGTPNDRYMRVDGGNAVGVLAVTTARDLSKGKLELADRGIFKFDPIDLQAIRRTMDGKDLELTMDAANWSITKPAKTAADQPMVEELADRLGNLRAERIADIEGKDLPKFGLDKPAATLKLEMIGKGAKTVEKALKIGAPVDPAKPEGERFAQAEGASTVVVLSAFMSKKMLADPIKFRERNLASFVTADKATVTRNGKDTTFEKVGGVWKVKQPAEGDAEDEGLRELLDLLARLRAEEIVAEKPADLKPYGLDKPDRWKWFNGDKEVLNLLVGSPEKAGDPTKPTETMRSYAKLDKGDMVVLLDMALSTKLRAEYRKRALWEPLDVAQAMMVIVDTPEGPGSFKLTKGPTGWIDPVNMGDKIDTAAVTDFLDAFAGLKAERFVDTDAKEGAKIFGLDPARKTITINTQGGQSRTLLLGRVDEQKRVYGQSPGRKDVFVLNAGDTAKINRDRVGFLVSPPKEEPKKTEPKKATEPKKDESKKDEPKKDEPKKDESKKDAEPKK